MRLLGLETEYGMLIEGKDPSVHIDEAASLVCAYPGIHATGWDYRYEDPRCDARGFRVSHLATDPNDAQFDRPDTTPRPPQQVRSDRVLTNGARLYNDHGHPEYATPECLSLRDLVAHDRAGERIVLACARARAQQLGVPIWIYKNNTDFHGASYGTHENYLMARQVPFEAIVAGLMPFLVTRPIYAGAGKVGAEPHNSEVTFQLSQRADFFNEEASVDTLYRRPIINTRDEPHADPRLYRRLHVICGDANMNPFATWLKVGATSLVLGLLERGWQPPWRVHQPVAAAQRLSRDPTLRWLVEMENGQRIPAVEIQRVYLQAVKDAGVVEEGDDGRVASEWERVLDALERDPLSLGDCLDWVAKRHLLEAYREAEGLSWGDDALRSLDLEYHNVAPEEGLYRALEADGAPRAWISEPEVVRALQMSPPQTRAAIRGACVRRFSQAIRSVSWTGVVFGCQQDAFFLDLRDIVDGSAAELAEAVEQLESVEELLKLVDPSDR